MVMLVVVLQFPSRQSSFFFCLLPLLDELG
jgi:hypothetical protein